MVTRKGSLAVIDGEKKGRLVIFGDIHGDIDSLEKGLSYWQSGDLLLFLGDYADRGAYGIEVIEKIDSLIESFPNNVIALRGNHEEYEENGTPTFSPCTLINEAVQKKGSWESYRPAFRAFVSKLFLSAYLPGFAIFVHGGITGAIRSLDQLASPTVEVKNCLMWSDPGRGTGERPNPRGIGTLFGKDVSEAVLNAIGIRHIFRSHEPRKARSGLHFDHGGRVVTTSSTSVYGGRPFITVLAVDNLPITVDDLMDMVVYLDT